MNFTNCTTEFSSGKFGFIFLRESKIAAEPLASGCLQGSAVLVFQWWGMGAFVPQRTRS